MVVYKNAKFKMKKEKCVISSKAISSILLSLPFPAVAVITLLFTLDSLLFAQELNVSSRVDTNHILIGDHINLYINLEYNQNTKVSWLTVPDSLEGFEILNRTQPVVKQTGQMLNEQAVFTITAFDTGVFIIPSLKFAYSSLTDTTQYFASTSPILVRVHSVGVNPEAEIKDIKPPLSVPITFAEILPYLIGIIVLGTIIYLIYYLRRKRKSGITEIFSKPKRPAHEIALEALQSLEAEKLWQRGEIKLYYSKLTDIVRTYIENRFNILAMESTTEEIISELKKTGIDNGMNDSLHAMLVSADLVKFAKSQPLPNENDLNLRIAYDYIQKTIPTTKPEVESKV